MKNPDGNPAVRVLIYELGVTGYKGPPRVLLGYCNVHRKQKSTLRSDRPRFSAISLGMKLCADAPKLSQWNAWPFFGRRMLLLVLMSTVCVDVSDQSKSFIAQRQKYSSSLPNPQTRHVGKAHGWWLEVIAYEQQVRCTLRLRGGADDVSVDVQERIEKEKKESKKRRLEKKKWKQHDKDKKLAEEAEKEQVRTFTGPDGVIYALDPDFPAEVNFVPTPLPEHDPSLDTTVTKEQDEEDEHYTARDEAKQFESFTRKPLADPEFEKELLDLVSECEKVKQTKRGANEVTKSVNRNTAEFIVIAADTIPIEIVLHLPLLCEDKGVPFVWVSTRNALSKALQMPCPVTAVSVLANERSHLAGRIRKLRAKVDSLAY